MHRNLRLELLHCGSGKVRIPISTNTTLSQRGPGGCLQRMWYPPSSWRSTQIQQGSGFLQELKAAIELDQLESRAGTVTWGWWQNNKVHLALFQDFPTYTTHHHFCRKRIQYSERQNEKNPDHSLTGKTLTHQSPLPGDKTCPADSFQLCLSCP